MRKGTWTIAILGVLSLAILSCALIAIGRNAAPTSHYDLMEDAAVGSDFSRIVERYGQAESQAPNNLGGETYTFKTEIDWDKFIENRLVLIDTDQTGKIVEVRSELAGRR